MGGAMQGKLWPLMAAVAWVCSACLGGGSGDGQSKGGNRSGGSSNRPPTISGWPPPAVLPGEAYEFTPAASDPDGDTLTFRVLRKPHWLAFDPATGRLAGVPDESDLGPYSNIQISVSDGHATVVLSAFDIVVNQVGEGVVTLSWTPPTENADGSVLTDLAGYRVYYGQSARNLNQSIVLNNPGLTRYVVEYLPRGRWTFAMTSVNAAGTESARSARVSKVVG